MRGRGRIHGAHGGYAKLTADVFEHRQFPAAREALDAGDFAAGGPRAVLYRRALADEIRFCRKWSAILEDSEKRPQRLWDLATRADNLISGTFSVWHSVGIGSRALVRYVRVR